MAVIHIYSCVLSLTYSFMICCRTLPVSWDAGHYNYQHALKSFESIMNIHSKVLSKHLIVLVQILKKKSYK